MIGSFIFWWKTEYKPALNNSNDQYQIDTQPQESFVEEQPILKTEKDLLPSCYDRITIDTVKDVLLSEANDRKNAKNSTAIQDYINMTDIKLENITIASEASEGNLVNVCQADIKITYPYLDDETLKKISSDFIFWINFSGKRSEFESLPQQIQYEVKYVYNEDGEKQPYVTVNRSGTYGTTINYMAGAYVELLEKGK